MTVLKTRTDGDGYTHDDSSQDDLVAQRIYGEAKGTEAYPHFLSEARNNLAAAFQGKPALDAFLQAVAASADEIEATCFDIINQRLVDNATGQMLVQLGRAVLAQVRSDFPDASNVALIDVQSKLYLATLYWDSLQDILQVLFDVVELHYSDGAEVVISMSSPTPGYEGMTVAASSTLSWNFFREAIASRVLPAGVGALSWLVADGPGLYFDDPLGGLDASEAFSIRTGDL